MGLTITQFNKSGGNKTLHKALELDGSLGAPKATEHRQNYDSALGGLIWLRIGDARVVVNTNGP